MEEAKVCKKCGHIKEIHCDANAESCHAIYCPKEHHEFEESKPPKG
jgi:hypothetical protein